MNANLTLYLPQVLLTWRPNPAGQFLDVSNPAGQFLDVFKHCGAVFGRFPTLRFSSWAFLTRGKFLDVPNPARRFFDVSSFKTIISRKLSDSVKILVFQKKKNVLNHLKRRKNRFQGGVQISKFENGGVACKVHRASDRKSTMTLLYMCNPNFMYRHNSKLKIRRISGIR